MTLTRLAPLFLALVAMVAISACAPDTIIRRSAFIPGPAQVVRSGHALEKGQARFSGHINAANTGGEITNIGLISEVGDPGVFIPDFELGASAYVGLPVGLELGAQFSYASLDWAYRNTPGVLEFPDTSEQELLKVGIGIRYNFPLKSEELKLSIVGQFDYVSIPQAIFLCETCTGEDTIGAERARDAYKLQRIETEGFLLPNFAVQFGYQFDERFLVYSQLGFQAGVTNIGFDNNLASLADSTLERFAIGYFGIGADIKLDRFVAGTSVYLPFESLDRIDFGIAFAANIGVLID